MRYLGEFSNTQTVRFLWNTTASGGASVTRATNGSIRIYKNNSTTQRTSSNGITDTEDFDSLTGVHLCSIDLSDNTDSGFYGLGRFQVVLEGATIDGSSVNAVLAYFDITIAGGFGGGGGSNPAAGTVPSTIPLVFCQIRTVGGTNYYFAHGTQLNDPSTWYGGPKKPKLLDVSKITRRLSRNGEFDGVRFTVTLADTDRQFRTLVASGALRGAYCAVYVVDDATRRAQGDPFRIAAGKVVEHRAGAQATYELTVVDVLSRLFEDFEKQPMVPPTLLTSSVFPTIDDATDGKPAQVVCGLVSDLYLAQDPPVVNPTPQGVVAPQFLGGPINFQSTFGGSNINVYVWIWCQGAVIPGGVAQVYFNDPATPNLRSEVPVSSWGTEAWTPGKPGWSAVGVSTDYVDYNGVRYTPLFILSTQPAVEAILSGKMLVAANIYGSPTNGDGTGGYINNPAFLWQHIMTLYVFNTYLTGSYPSLPTLDGSYSVIDTSSVTAANTAHTARIGGGGYISGFVLGGLGEQQSVFDVIGELCAGADMDQGINRHGQLMLSVENTAASATDTLTATLDIETDSYEVWIAHEDYYNRVVHRFARYYVPPSAPAATPAEGEASSSNPLQLQPEWDTVDISSDTGAQSSVGGEVATYTLDNYVIRDAETALNVSSTILTRAVGPQDDGPRMCRFTGGWRLTGTGSSAIDLGSVINVKHPLRVGTESGTDKCRVMAIEIEPIRHRVTLECRIIG